MGKPDPSLPAEITHPQGVPVGPGSSSLGSALRSVCISPPVIHNLPNQTRPSGEDTCTAEVKGQSWGGACAQDDPCSGPQRPWGPQGVSACGWAQHQLVQPIFLVTWSWLPGLEGFFRTQSPWSGGALVLLAPIPSVRADHKHLQVLRSCSSWWGGLSGIAETG